MIAEALDRIAADVRAKHKPIEAGRHGVYVLANAADEPLYIGSSVNPGSRLTKHVHTAWGSEIAHVYIEWFVCTGQAKICEFRLLAELDPPHNVWFTSRDRRLGIHRVAA